MTTGSIKLPQVTLIALADINLEGHYRALEHSQRGIEFGAVKLITELQLGSIDAWNKAIVYDLRRYVDTDYCMLIHADGFIVHPESWREEFLAYDFIGAPWPLPTDNYSYRTPDGEIVRVGNSVSIRSKRILNLPYELEMGWREYYGNCNEDGFITCHNRRLFQHFGARFAPIETAKYFSRELDIPENQDIESPFAFHLHDTMPGRNLKYKDLIV